MDIVMCRNSGAVQSGATNTYSLVLNILMPNTFQTITNSTYWTINQCVSHTDMVVHRNLTPHDSYSTVLIEQQIRPQYAIDYKYKYIYISKVFI